MQITWNIQKKRGNFRPCLNYSLILEPFEKKLAINAIQIETLIPQIPNPHQNYCMPGENERAPDWKPARFHFFSVPYFKTGEVHEFLRLPFRSSNEYPEVEESFTMLRDAYEALIRETYEQKPIDLTQELGLTSETRDSIVAGVTAQKLLGLYGEPTGQ